MAQNHRPDPDRLFTRPFLLCGLANLSQALAFDLFLHFPGFLKDLGAHESQIGLLFGLTAVASIAIRPTLGRVMDARGRRGVILAGNALNTIVMALYFTVDSIGPWVYVVRILNGLSAAMLFSALFTYAADCVPENRRMQGLMLFGVTGMLPIALGGLIGDAVLARADYDALFAVAFGFAVLAAMFALPLPEMSSRPTDTEEGTPGGFRKVLSQPDLVTLWGITTAFSIALAAMFTFLKTFVMATGVGSVGGFFGAYAGVAVLLRVALGWLPDRIGAKRVLFPALAVLATGFLLLADATNTRDVMIAGALCGAGHGYTFPLLFGMVVNRARTADRGTAMAIYTALFDLGVLIGSPLLGFVIDAYGYTAMFVTTAVLLTLGALAFAFADRGRA
jgi:predicted MFS family arabinose efflux permease